MTTFRLGQPAPWTRKDKVRVRLKIYIYKIFLFTVLNQYISTHLLWTLESICKKREWKKLVHFGVAMFTTWNNHNKDSPKFARLYCHKAWFEIYLFCLFSVNIWSLSKRVNLNMSPNWFTPGLLFIEWMVKLHHWLRFMWTYIKEYDP